MNPHDQLAKPAAHRVYERLGVDDVWTLLRRHPEESPEASLAWYLAASATAVDGVHRELAAAAKTAVETLSPVARGQYAGQSTHDGILRESGLRIDLLAARREAAFTQFAASLTSYARCTGADRTATTDAQSRQQPSPRQSHAGPALWDDEHDTARRALRDVQLGDLWMRENVLGGKEVIHGNGLGAPVEAETVEPLVAAGLIEACTATDAAQVGHMLSPPADRKAPEAAHAARQGEAAALYRGVAPTAANPATPAPLAASPARTSSSARTR
ncbi:hypothetical protein ACFY4B_41580 [Kitasatospora sp. NPDC001261]|uniref:hypothetical protein n=1 Tax=Kitasatospora sp. NPDC001261 TaxID=3364012 RepID=UPI0036A426D0